MNEKIKQLKEQATKIVETTDHCSGASESHAEVDLEKFAELIVRECLLELADVRLEHVFDPETDKLFVIAIDRIKTFRS